MTNPRNSIRPSSRTTKGDTGERVGHSASVPTLLETLGNIIRIVSLVRPYWSPTLKSLLLSLLGSLLGLAAPFLSKMYFDSVYPSRDMTLLAVLIKASFVLALAAALLNAIRGYYSSIITSSLGHSVNLYYFNHLQHLPMRFFDERRVGEITSRSGDLRASLGTVTRVVQTLLLNGLYIILIPPILLLLSWQLTLLAFVSVPITTILAVYASRISRRLLKRTAEASADLSAAQVEIFSQMRMLKSMGLEYRNYSAMRKQTELLFGLQSKTAAVGNVVGLVSSIVKGVSAAAFGWYAWSLVLRDELSLGGFIAYSGYLGLLTGPVGQVASLFSEVQGAAVTIGRAFEYLDKDTEQAPAGALDEPVERHSFQGRVALHNVSFGYSAGRDVIKSISASFAPGTISAILGESGTGKSTLARLLCRLDTTKRGRILLDEYSIADIPVSVLRNQIGIVWQDTALIHGTLLENLMLANPSASLDEVHRVVRDCQLESFVESIPDGLNAVVAEFGATLSGGQRQRVAIARALLRPSPVLVLDEVTSQLDPQTEAQLLEAILPRLRARTTILVTHRAATAAIADCVYSMRDGELVGPIVSRRGHFSAFVEEAAVSGDIHEVASASTDNCQ